LNYSNKDEIKVKGLDRMLCITNKSAMFLSGTFYTTEFTSLRIKMKLCTNSSTSNITCGTPEYIAATLAQTTF
jgi:hypothetical protein